MVGVVMTKRVKSEPEITMPMINGLIRTSVKMIKIRHFERYRDNPSMGDLDALAKILVQRHPWFRNAGVLKSLGDDPLDAIKRKVKKRFYNAGRYVIDPPMQYFSG